MKRTYSYACNDYPGMEGCPGRFSAATEDELWKLVELHAFGGAWRRSGGLDYGKPSPTQSAHQG